MSKPNGSEHERHDKAMDEMKVDEYKVINIEITAEMKVEDTANKIIELIEYMWIQMNTSEKISRTF